ncbi:MAG TPA: carboxypeptidase regulatory-like domain-containing protein [Bryobacteraceae bacterium]|jgi:hypothetical protein
MMLLENSRKAGTLRKFLPVLFASAIGWAQVTSGTIQGNIRDTTGAPVTAATVTLTEKSKGVSQKVSTDDTGAYNAQYLTPGTYRIEVEKSGFRRAASDNFVLNVDDRARLDFTLEVGELNQTVEVVAAAPLIRSESGELGEVITQHAVEDLPLNGRNFAQLVYLVPGVTSGQPGENLSGASTFNPRAGSNFNALGSQEGANGWLVDGIMDNEYTFNTVIVQPSVESIQEFKVLTGSFSAEFGRGAGIVTTQTKSGSDQLHGSAFEFLRNSFMDARNYFNAIPAAQPPFRRNQYGGSIGGRIIKNKLFFFGDYYAQRQLKGQTYLNSVPTALERAGNFTDYKNSSGGLIPIYDPTTTRTVNGQITRQQFAGNIIPANMINQVGFNVASIYPLPNGPGTLSNFTSTANNVIDDNGFNARLDYTMSEKDSMFARYSWEKFNLNAPQGQAACCLPTPTSAAAQFQLGPFVAGPQVTRLRDSGGAYGETHIFTPTLVNEFIAGFTRALPYTIQSDYGIPAATSLGILGINLNNYTSGLPNIAVGNTGEFTGISGGPAILPVDPRQTTYQIGDEMSKTLGSHQLKFGYRYIRNLISPYDNTNTRGTLNFADNFTNNPITNSGGNGIATLLLGYSTSGTRGYLIQPPYMKNQEHGAFLQDDWKVTRRLTVNMGLRYDVFVPDVEKYNHLTNFNLSTLTLVYAGENGLSRTAGRSTQFGNLGPRVGFAYDVTGKGTMVVRGGFGISYFPEQATATGLTDYNVPYEISQNYNPETYPLNNMAGVPKINQPFPAPVPVKPLTTADLNAANPSIVGNSFLNLTPYYESWNLNIERQLGHTMLAEIAYAGSRGIHLLYCYNPNEVEPGPGSNAGRRLLQPISNVSTINQCDPRNMSNYHSLQAKLTKRFSRGLQFLGSYTYSRSLDYGGTAAQGGGSVGNAQTITNLAAGYGPSGFDIKSRFVGSWSYELPFGKGKPWVNHGLLSNIIGGWEIDGISTLQTGLPFTVTLATGVNNGAPSWPNRIASGVSSNPDPYQWFNPAAFVAPPPNTYGNSARGVLYGPGMINFDLSGQRIFTYRERFQLRLRLDAFNAFNHPEFSNPSAAINPSAPAGVVGRISSTVIDNRDMQASLRLTF